MVGNFCNRTACRIRNRRRRHDDNMTLRKKKNPRASQHYLGWRAGQKSLLLPVAGEFFLLTLPFIERGYRPSGFPIARRISSWPELPNDLQFGRDPSPSANFAEHVRWRS